MAEKTTDDPGAAAGRTEAAIWIYNWTGSAWSAFLVDVVFIAGDIQPVEYATTSDSMVRVRFLCRIPAVLFNVDRARTGPAINEQTAPATVQSVDGRAVRRWAFRASMKSPIAGLRSKGGKHETD